MVRGIIGDKRKTMNRSLRVSLLEKTDCVVRESGVVVDWLWLPLTSATRFNSALFAVIRHQISRHLLPPSFILIFFFETLTMY